MRSGWLVCAAVLIFLATVVPASGPMSVPASGHYSVGAHGLRPQSASPSNVSGWTEVSNGSVTEPPAGGGFGLAYDPALGGVLAFGGGESTGVVWNQTWLFSNDSWTNLSPNLTKAPSPRADPAEVYDAALGGVLVFGGLSALNTVTADTWLFANGAWTNLTKNSTDAPPALFGPAFAYDSSAGEAVLFGGQWNGVYYNETWVYRNESWTEVEPSGVAGPSPRYYASLADDPAEQGVLLFGGQNPSGTDGDTWVFSNGTWRDLSSQLTTAPPPRRAAMMTYDATNASVLLFGGDATTSGMGLADTWRFLDGAWWNLTSSGVPSPTARWATSMVDDPSVNGTLLVGGCTDLGCTSFLRDAWTWSDVGFDLAVTPHVLDGVVPLHASFEALVHGGLPPYAYRWSVGSGPFAPGTATWNETFSTPAVESVTVVVVDRGGGVLRATGTVNASAPVAPLEVTLNVTTAVGEVPYRLAVSAQAQGGTGPFAFSWRNASNATFVRSSENWETVYSTPGAYTLTVSVEDQGGITTSANLSVEVLPPLSVGLNAPAFSGVAPLALQLLATPTGGDAPYSYLWSVTAGGPTAPTSGSDWNVTVTQAGSWDVTVSVRDALGYWANATAHVTVTSAPSAQPTTSNNGVWIAFTFLALLAVGVVVGVLLFRRRPPAKEGSESSAESQATDPGSAASATAATRAAPTEGLGPAIPPTAASAGAPDVTAGGVPQSNRILVHLLSLGPLLEGQVAPVARTQEGLATVLGRPQSSFARVLQRLEEAGLVRHELRHVQGKARRMQVYSLTDRGIEYARDLRRRSTGTTVPGRNE